MRSTKAWQLSAWVAQLLHKSMPMPWIITAQLGSDGCELPTPCSTNRDLRGKKISTMSPALGAARCCLSPVCAEGFQNDGRGPGRTSQALEPISSHFTASLWKTRSGSGQVPGAVPEHTAPCTGSPLICKLHPFDLASLWGSSLFPGTNLMEEPKQRLSEQQLQPGCPARKPRVLPGASGGSVGGTLHPQGASTFPKVSPALAAPATTRPPCSGAARGAEPCSPPQGCSSLHHVWGYPLEVHPGNRIQISFQSWKRATAKVSAFSFTAHRRTGACGRSHSECPEMCGIWRVFSPRNSQAGLGQEAAIWEELP